MTAAATTGPSPPPSPSSSEPGNGRSRVTRALRHRNYRLFFVGQLISLIGNFLTLPAIAWLVFGIAKDEGRAAEAAWMLGVVAFAGQVPVSILIVRPIYVRKGIITEVATGLQTATAAPAVQET